MLPTFPQFKKLELSDQHDIRRITDKYPPYSDFNFISMWSWDVKGDMRISELNGNLVARFNDYITGEPFYSFLGENKPHDTVERLLELSRAEGLIPKLKLIPAICFPSRSLDVSEKFTVVEDPDNFDYLYSLDKLSSYDGNKLRSKRNLTNRFNKFYVAETKLMDVMTGKFIHELDGLFGVWVKNKGVAPEEAAQEFWAFNRALRLVGRENLLLVSVYIDGVLVGVTINELLETNHVVLHFEKADEKFLGIYAYLMQRGAMAFMELQKGVLNYEQDLGVPGLRLAKKSFRPASYLKKYLVQV